MKNRIQHTLKMVMFALGIMAASASAQAAVVAYENVGFIKGSDYFSESFQISTAGTYKAMLTDFDFPSLFDQLSMTVTTSSTTHGELSAPGSFTFEALPGTYYASLFGVAGGALDLGLYGVQIEQLGASVSAVPLPGAALLLASGLGLFGGMAWRRRENSGA